jgi:hypothetical protein
MTIGRVRKRKTEKKKGKWKGEQSKGRKEKKAVFFICGV